MEKFFERLLLLKKTSTFADVSSDDLRFVVAELKEEAFAAGERVFDIGDPSDRMYLAESGKVGISLDENPGKQTFVGIIGPGGCFGEMGLFDDLPRSATAHVVEDSVLLALERDKLRGLIISYPQLGLGLLRGMSRRLRDTNQLFINGQGG